MSPVFGTKLTLCVVLTIPLMLSIGCGSASEIEGHVFLDGRPLDGAVIRLKRVGNPEAKEISADVNQGSFTISGANWVKPGEYYVTFLPQQPGAGAMIQGVERGEGIPPPKTFVPRVYQEIGDLKANIAPGTSNRLVFQLKSFRE